MFCSRLVFRVFMPDAMFSRQIFWVSGGEIVQVYHDSVEVQEDVDGLGGDSQHQGFEFLLAGFGQGIDGFFRHVSLFYHGAPDVAFFLKLDHLFVDGGGADLYPAGYVSVLYQFLNVVCA